MPRLLLAVLLAFALSEGLARAQSETPEPGTIDATISTQNGTVLLPGVLVLVRSAGGDQVGEQVSDGAGHVAIGGLAPGVYRLQASLDGFDAAERSVTLARDSGAAVTIDMAISAVSERV